ncbi:MAG: chemotaxis protein CheX [bacterium]
MSSPEEQLNTLMMRAVNEVLENMAFMEVLPNGEPLRPEDIPNLTWSSLLVNDPVLGEFQLFMSKSLAMKIAESVYGLPEEELTDLILCDTLGEMLNTIVGRFFNAVLPAEQTFTLGLPEVVPMQDKTTEHIEFPQIDSPSIEWNFNLEEEPILLASSGETLVHWLHTLEV